MKQGLFALVLTMASVQTAGAEQGSGGSVALASAQPMPTMSQTELASLAGMSLVGGPKTVVENSAPDTEEMGIIKRHTVANAWNGGALYFPAQEANGGVVEVVLLPMIGGKVEHSDYAVLSTHETWRIKPTWCNAAQCVFTIPASVGSMYSHIVTYHASVFLMTDGRNSGLQCQVKVPAHQVLVEQNIDDTEPSAGLHYRTLPHEATCEGVDCHRCDIIVGQFSKAPSKRVAAR